ncbi:MAG: SDR family NAD(P)-dependent oxidoreductase [Chthoniobacterales bacterium]|nr:SDR family NAD(P)-dependent oxidoreductase [Chthoniobacterales bacterium]
MKILITGGCGFLGSNLAFEFLKNQEEVVIVDSLYRVGGKQNLEWLKANSKEKQFHFYQVDIACDKELEMIFQRHAPFDYICHFAGQVAMTTSLKDPKRDFLTNVVGTFNLLEFARIYSPETFLAYSSTNKVYGDLNFVRLRETPTRYEAVDFPNGFDETLPLDFASPYGCSKGAADQYVRDWYRNFGIKTVVFRHSSIYGGRQFSTYDQGWVGWFCKKAIEQKNAWLKGEIPEPFTISGSGKQVRDVLHAEDLINLYLMAFEKKEQIAGEVFNIGGGIDNSLSLLELFSFLENLLEMPKKLIFNRTERRKSDQDFFVSSNKKAKEKLNWEPKIRYICGIQNVLNWINNQN